VNVSLNMIEMREILHFLGWRGSPVEEGLLAQIDALRLRVIEQVQPRIVIRRFSIDAGGVFSETAFAPRGQDVRVLLSACKEAYLMAATLGAQSERMILREQAVDPAGALLIDAVLSAAIEAACDQAEEALRKEAKAVGEYLTSRFSPGYGDMPIEQTKEICKALDTPRSIGLTVSRSGVMIPRKSVTALIGISRVPTLRRPDDCAACAANASCLFARRAER